MDITLREFGKQDWNLYSGAEKFEDGTQPLIKNGKLIDGTDFDIIVDREGIQVEFYDYELTYMLNIILNKEAMTMLAQLAVNNLEASADMDAAMIYFADQPIWELLKS